MAQPLLIDRPVILSKHKQNVISHGRPLSPMGSVRSLSPYVPRKKDARANESCISIKPISLMNYQKEVHESLVSINRNLSCMVQETFSGIDDICRKVHLCLLEAQPTNNMPSNYSMCPIIPSQPLVTCPEKPTSLSVVDRQSSNDEVIDLTEVDEDGDKKDVQTQKSIKKCDKKIVPFFTIFHPQTQSCESVGVINSISSKVLLNRKCTAENFQKSMAAVQKLNNYEKLLTNMVANIDNEIKKSFSQYKSNDTSCEEPSKVSLKRRKQRKSTSSIRQSITTKKRDGFEEIKKSDQNCKDNASDTSINIKSICLEKLDYSQADVYRKRAITDLHQRMVVQIEANDSFIFFQKLMSKNRKHIEKNKLKAEEPNNIRSRASMSSVRIRKSSEKTNLSQKYQNSLWFKNIAHENKRAKADKKHRKQKGVSQAFSVHSNLRSKGQKSKKETHEKLHQSNSQYKLRVINNQPISDQQRDKLQFFRTKYSQYNNNRLKYMDILDDITEDDLTPLRPEYPRRDTIQQNIKGSYLYKLLNEKGKYKKAWIDLLQPPGSTEALEKSTDQPPIEEKRSIVESLSKYIFIEQEETTQPSENYVFTVMPVHVVYDKSKLPVIPMKESKDIRKAEWVKETPKKSKTPKVLYDPILRKINKELTLASTRREARTTPSKVLTTHSWSPKNFSQFVSQKIPVRVDMSKKTPDSVPVRELYKRSSKTSKPVENPPMWSPYSLDSTKNDLRVRKKIEKDMEIQSANRLKTESQRKMYENKYGKTTGQKLLNFIEKQPLAYQPPVPKYALPKSVKEPVQKQQQMMEHFKNLKQKNNDIQSTISKAISVIENRMVDILEKPSTAQSLGAFDDMEKEISNVLTLMKSGSKNEKRTKLAKVEELDVDMDQISDDLFKKLDRILETPKPSYLQKSSKDNLMREIKLMVTPPVTASRDMRETCFSTTSGDEKLTVTAISPKRKAPEIADLNTELNKLRSEFNYDGELLLPVQKQIVNLALIAPTKNNSSGDQMQVDEKSCESDVTVSPNGDGDGLSPTTSTSEQDEIKEESTKLTIETVDNYLTPQTSPSNELAEDHPEEQCGDTFYDNVDKIISRVESVYHQLEHFEEEGSSTPSKMSLGRAEASSVTVDDIETDAFLTPFMHAVKDLKRTVEADKKPKTPKKTSSYFNVLAFLDNLNDLKSEQPVDVYTPRIVNTAYACHIPITLYIAQLMHQIKHDNDNIHVPKKPSSCLKDHSSNSFETDGSKTKQVSFLLKMEEKSTQAKVCPLHAASLNESNSDISQSMTEEFETNYFTDDPKKCELPTKMPEAFTNFKPTIDYKKNVVELYRNIPEGKKIKVFYDNYKGTPEKIISGFYNENSILQVKASLGKDVGIKRSESVKKILETLNSFDKHMKDHQLLEPLKEIHKFIDPKLIKEAVEYRQQLRNMRKNKLIVPKRNPEDHSRETLLKGVYVFVYLLMFTALNMEYKCVL